MEKDYTKQIINKIESVINKKNWNANIVATKAGMNSQTLRDILKADDIKLSKLIMISRALSVDVVDWFMDDPDFEYTPKVLVGQSFADQEFGGYRKNSTLEYVRKQLAEKERYIQLLEKTLKTYENKDLNK